VPAAENRFAFRSQASGRMLTLDPPAVWPPGGQAPQGPSPAESIEIYRIRQLPAILQAALPAAIRGLALEELAGKQYDKTRTHKTETHVYLPAPTLKDPLRTKRRDVPLLAEQYHLQAQLDGKSDLRIPVMLCLANRAEKGPGLILLAVEAQLPVRGHVQYKLPHLASASTGYRATVQLSAVAELQIRHTGKDVTFAPPAVKELRISLAHLDLSNDLLESSRHAIEHLVNHELRQNEERIRQQANKSLAKAMSAHELRIPLLGCLGLL
jgi:hypothetical protein